MAAASRRMMRLVVLVALAALAFMLNDYIKDQRDQRQLRADYRVPVANPPVEPDRPDLFEEPKIEVPQ